MVVRNNDAGGTVGNGVSKNFARMNWAAVNQTNRNDTDVQNLVRTVDRGADEVFLLPVSVVADVRQQVGWSLNLRALWLDASSGELDGRQNQRGLRIAHAFKLRQVFCGYFQPLFVN